MSKSKERAEPEQKSVELSEFSVVTSPVARDAPFLTARHYHRQRHLETVIKDNAGCWGWRAAQPFTRYSNNKQIKRVDLPLISCSSQLRHTGSNVKREVYLNTAVQPEGVRISVNFWNRSSTSAFKVFFAWSLYVSCYTDRVHCQPVFKTILLYCTMFHVVSLYDTFFQIGTWTKKKIFYLKYRPCESTIRIVVAK